jgi:diadenosine tetraphosphate (Ap4A) HIT family hydrolase
MRRSRSKTNYMGKIRERVAAAQAGKHPTVICRMASGWAVMGDVQVLPGYCLLLPDPVVTSLNDLQGAVRTQFLEDYVRLGDAVLKVTGALRINYEILGNVVPELHAHVFPRYANEPEDLRLKAVWFYDWGKAPKYSEAEHGVLREKLRAELESA